MPSALLDKKSGNVLVLVSPDRTAHLSQFTDQLRMLFSGADL